MPDNYVYLLDGKAYINLTNKCHNACTFCLRNTGDGVRGATLWLENEPDASQVLSAFDKLSYPSGEVVFCGYGEPTENMAALVPVAAELKRRGYKLRLNTNGLGCAVNGRNIVPELGDIDVVSISLNNCTAEKYYEVTRSSLGLGALAEVIAFAEACKAAGRSVVLTVVDVIGKDDIAGCRRIADSLGVPLRVREYIADNYNGN